MLTERYRLQLLEHLLASYLLQGRVPTPTRLAKDLQRFAPLLEQPQPLVHALAPGQVTPDLPARAADYNRFFELFSQDAALILEEGGALLQAQEELFLRRLTELRQLYHQVRRLAHELDSLILVQRETVGYGGYAADNFTDATQVDLQATTAMVDLSEKCVTLRPDLPVVRLYPLHTWEMEAPEVQVLTQTGLRRQGINLGDSVHLYQPGEDLWRLALHYNRGDQEVTIDITFRLPQLITLNYLLLGTGDLQTQKTRGQFFYSTDAYSWYELPTGTSVYYLPETLQLHCRTVQCRWLRLRLTRERPDVVALDDYRYEFALRQLQLGYQTTTYGSGTLVTRPRVLTDAQGRPARVTQVALEVCEALPPGSDIIYEVSFDRGASYQPISPLGRQQRGAPAVVRLSGTQTLVFDQLAVDRETDYPYASADLTLLDLAIASDCLPGSLRLWRNLVQPGLSWPVRQGLAGWYLDGQHYCCTGLVAEKQPLTLNLGPTTMWIDGQPATGVVRLEPGIYQFRCDRAHWAPLLTRGNRSVTDITQVTELGQGRFQGTRRDGLPITATDPLYPYNHKLLLEGLPYRETEKRTGVYQGLHLVAESLVTIVGLAELLHHPACQGLHHAALVSVITPTGPQQRLLLRYQPRIDDLNDYRLERFRLSYQRPTTTEAQEVVLRATFTMGSAPPKLYYYILKGAITV